VALDIARRALDLGINLFDTAEIMASDGRADLGSGARRPSRQAFIATKLFPILPIGPIVEQRAASARRLAVTHIDLYQLHWPNRLCRWKRRWRGCAACGDRGSTCRGERFGLGRWEYADRALGEPVLSNQVEFSLVARRAEAKLLPWAQANERIIIAYSPLAQGVSCQRWDGKSMPGGVRSNNAMFLPETGAWPGTFRCVARHRGRSWRHAIAGGVGAGWSANRTWSPSLEPAASSSSRETQGRPTSFSPTTTTIGSLARPATSSRSRAQQRYSLLRSRFSWRS
jgi:aryl-alcohol dehydrogenase-like predicted oxidoreductase